MSMADEKNGKKDKEEKTMSKDDLFGGMDDVIGERKVSEAAEAPKPAEEAKPVEEAIKASTETAEPITAPEEPKILNHKKLRGDEATSVSAKAEQNMIWLIVGDVTYTIDEISPENFLEWIYDKIPVMKKKREIKPEQCKTARQRLDIFEEVISILTKWYYASQAKNKNNISDF